LSVEEQGGMKATWQLLSWPSDKTDLRVIRQRRGSRRDKTQLSSSCRSMEIDHYCWNDESLLAVEWMTYIHWTKTIHIDHAWTSNRWNRRRQAIWHYKEVTSPAVSMNLIQNDNFMEETHHTEKQYSKAETAPYLLNSHSYSHSRFYLSSSSDLHSHWSLAKCLSDQYCSE